MTIAALVILPALWIWPQRGLNATYHANTEWIGEPLATRIETRLTAEVMEEQRDTMPQQRFSMLMVGWVRIDEPGEYQFSTRSDDGSTLDVAGQRVVDNGGYHAPRTASGRITLARGFHPLRLRFIQGSGSYSLSVLWTPPGGSESAIPPGMLYAAEPALPGLAFAGRNAVALWVAAWIVLAAATLARFALAISEPGRVRRAAFAGLAGATATVVAVLCVELGLRVIGYAREDRRSLDERLATGRGDTAATVRMYSLGDLVQPSRDAGIVYELKPNLRGAFENQPLATNAQGLRDKSYELRKPQGVIRIAALGDSSLFGWGVRVEDATTEVLEQMLNGTPGRPPVEVINFATPGYNTAIEAEVFAAKALAYDPDIVLINFNTNDYDVPAFMRLPQDHATLRRSFLFDFLYSEYEARAGVAPRELPVFDFTTRTMTLEEADRLDQDPGLPEEYRYMVGARGFERAIDKIVATARSAGVEVIVFDVRPYPGVHQSYVPNAFRDSQRELLERLSKEKGFRWLNTYRYYADYLKANPTAPFPRVFAVSDTDSHPSVLAHRISAQAVYDYLTEQKLLPAATPAQE